MREKGPKAYNILQAALFIMVFVIYATMFYMMWQIILNPLRTTPFENKGNYLMLAGYVMLAFLLLRFYGGLQFGEKETADVLASHGAAMLVCNGLSFLICFPVIGTWHYWVQMIVAFCCLEIGDCLVLLFLPWVNRVMYRIKPKKETILVYSTEPKESIVACLVSGRTDIRITAQYNETEALQAMREGRYDCAILLDLSEEKRSEFLLECYRRHMEVFAPFKVTDTIMTGAGSASFGDMLTFHIGSERQSFLDRMLKRVGDIVLAVFLLIVLAPLMGVIAVLVCMDGKQVFYCQERCTIGGKRFFIYKFRSMQPDTEHVNRVTTVGKMLRRTHLDELPQLINILKGDMSFVGPRPERPELVEQYCRELPEFSLRMDVKAGLTGYAQVYGSYGTTPEDKLRMDLMYINSHSMLLDLKLLLMTVKTVLRKENGDSV